jgi:hypothetical protein
MSLLELEVMGAPRQFVPSFGVFACFRDKTLPTGHGGYLRNGA